MKVTPAGNPPIQANDTTNTSRAEKNAQTHKTKKEIPEGVSSKISSRAREFIKAKELASQAPDIREQRVAELKKKIAEGKYHVDVDAVADRLVEEHLQAKDLG